jgi:deoxyadenosine/deoxycytidine kinase
MLKNELQPAARPAREGRLILSLEGNIGAGKSTVGQRMKASGLFDFLEEPISLWREGFAANLLERMYAEMERWAFTFQIMAFVTRVKTWQEILSRTAHPRVVLERSVFTDRHVFAANLHRLGAISEVEWELYCGLWDFLVSQYCVQPDHIIYLRTPVEVCLERIRARGRKEESRITLDYLRQIEELHDRWLLGHPAALVLDGTRQWRPEEILERLRLPVGGKP